MQYQFPDNIRNEYHAIYDEQELYTFWKTQLEHNFLSIYGESIQIIHPGIENHNSWCTTRHISAD